MAEYSKFIITELGQQLIAKMLSGTGGIEFSRIVATEKKYNQSQLQSLTELTEITQSSSISQITMTNETSVKVEAGFSNIDLKTGYYMNTLGLYANDPDEGEILYGVTVETSGNCYMPPYNGLTVTGAIIELTTTVGNAENVSLNVDNGVFATVGNLALLRNKVYEDIEDIKSALLNLSIIEDVFSSVFTEIAEDETALSSADITEATSTEWNGSSSTDETALSSADVSEATSTE